MRKFSVFLLSLVALNLSFGEEAKAPLNEREELKKQKEMLTEMREGLSEQDQAALEKDFEQKLAEIDLKIAQLEEGSETHLPKQ